MKNSIGHSLPICSRLTSPRPRWILTRMEFPAKTTSTTVSAMWRWSRRWCILALTTLIWSYSLQVLGAVHIDYVITDGGGSAETPKLYYVIYEQPLLIRHTDDWYYCLYAVLKYFRSISRGPFLNFFFHSAIYLLPVALTLFTSSYWAYGLYHYLDWISY